MGGAPNGAVTGPGGLTRARATLLVLALTLAGLGLRLWELDFGLPLVLHGDHAQVEQAAELVATGGFADRAPYPPSNVLVLAALDVAVGRLGLWTGRAPWSDWDGFLAALSRADLSHRVARWWSALAGALLAPAAYRLARVALGRGPALLAAASATLCPIAVATSHQARIHAPGVTVLVFAAVLALRCVRSPGARRALTAGLATGVAASVIQLGVLLAAATTVSLLLAQRPFGRALRLAALHAVAVAAAMALLEGLARLVADIRPPDAGQPADSLLTLGIPATALGLRWERLPQLAATWMLGEPVRAVLAVVGIGAAALGRLPRRPLLLYGVYPLVVLIVLGSNYTQARYVLSLTPFLAPLAVLGLQAIAARPLRAVAAALLVVSPLVASVRYDMLLGAGDTRLRLAGSVATLDDPGGPVLFEDSLLPHGTTSPAWVRRFPENGDFRPWLQGRATRETSFAAAAPVVFVREPAARHRLDDGVLEARGLQRVGGLETGCRGESTFPDPTEAMAIDVWRARCAGVEVEVWAQPGEPTRVAQRLLSR